jgi:hypothetical protein
MGVSSTAALAHSDLRAGIDVVTLRKPARVHGRLDAAERIVGHCYRNFKGLRPGNYKT